MSTIDALLDAAMKAVHAKNDTELAKALGIKPAAVSNYRRGVSLPNAVVCATLAGLTGEPLAKVLGVVGEARAISSDEKAVWRRLAATAMTLVLGVSLALPVRAEAAVKGFQSSAEVYIMRNDTEGGAVAAPLDLALDQDLPADRDLVAPSGERIPERRLRGLLWHANATDIRASVRRRNAKRKAVQQSLVKVVVMDLGEQREQHFGKIAGQDVGALRYRFIPTAHQPTLEPPLAGD
ncbi:DUF3693 domain-containing protein [Xanthomonas euvesicatoria]|uniref:DUF3693 domain-containing protein n=1 Tax=Xanthomonas euvesicatoria TaxID=456327 RepID=UPI0035592C9A